jgi:hypothetical protein
MMKKDKLLKLITDEEREILKSAMLKDNLYRQNTYYNEYIKKLQNKYVHPLRKYSLPIVIFITLIASIVIFKIYPERIKSFSTSLNNFLDSNKIINEFKHILGNKLVSTNITEKVDKPKKVSKMTFNYGYCTEKECTINVFNHEKRINQYITLHIKNKEMVLGLRKGMLFTLD